jgi:hypothetical protein
MAVGSSDKARDMLAKVDMSRVPPAYQKSFDAIVAFANGGTDETLRAVDEAVCAHVDPEALFLFGLMLSRVGAAERGLEIIAIAVESGYTPVATLQNNEAFNAVRDRAAFKAIEENALQRMRAAEQVFEAAGGPELLGMPAATRLSNG